MKEEFTAKSAKSTEMEGGWNHDAMSRVQTWISGSFAFFAVNSVVPLAQTAAVT
jgi:hypothetical protein